jgi:hypothetical protein
MEDVLLLASDEEGDFPLAVLVRPTDFGGSFASVSFPGDLLFGLGDEPSSMTNLTCLLLRYFSYGKLSLLELKGEEFKI